MQVEYDFVPNGPDRRQRHTMRPGTDKDAKDLHERRERERRQMLALLMGGMNVPAGR